MRGKIGARNAGLAMSLALSCVPAWPADVTALFGARVTPLADPASPVAKGDFAGVGESDQVYFVHVAPAAGGNAIAPDVRVVSSLHGKVTFGAATTGAALAIVMPPPRGKFLIIDADKAGPGSFDSPSWSDPDAIKHPAKLPIHVVMRLSAELKTFPCLRKPPKGDVLMLGSEAGIDVALDWTGSTFKICADPTQEP